MGLSEIVAKGVAIVGGAAEAEVQQAHDRIALQRSLGLDVEWLGPADLDARHTGLAQGVTGRVEPAEQEETAAANQFFANLGQLAAQLAMQGRWVDSLPAAAFALRRH